MIETGDHCLSDWVVGVEQRNRLMIHWRSSFIFLAAALSLLWYLIAPLERGFYQALVAAPILVLPPLTSGVESEEATVEGAAARCALMF
jgi:hypothetical protein